MVRELQRNEARAGRTTGHVRWILGISIAAAAIAMVIAVLVY